MKWIISIFFFLTLLVSNGNAVVASTVVSNNGSTPIINECKSDLYYANGVGMQLSEPIALLQWKRKTNELLSLQIGAQIDQRKIAYNQSQGFVNDLLESFEQQVNNEWNWPGLTAFLQTYMLTHNMQDILTAHSKNMM